MHNRNELHIVRSECIWQRRRIMHLHMFDWIRWCDMQLMRDVLHWLPDVHSDALHHRH